MGVIWSTLSDRFEDVETIYCLHALYPEASFGRDLGPGHRISQTTGASIEIA
jgi:hypothetical protein